MRTGEELSRGWTEIFDDPMLSMDLLKERGLRGEIRDGSLRSLYWKIYLDYLPSLETTPWPLILSKERQGYAELKAKFIFDPNKVSAAANDYSLNNPLSLADDSPWTQYFKDAELQKVIRQDVERTFPDQPIFRTQPMQNLMSDILFIWCKLNPDVSYRQGMHELLAPILLVVHKDQLDPASDTSGLNPVLVATFDSTYVEHDAAVLFYRLMRATKPWFEVGEEAQSSRPARSIQKSRYEEHRRGSEPHGKQVPIITICKRVQSDLLRVVDHDLYQHLEKQGIEPQLYGIRWLRLLFGREFPIPELFTLWDGLFADNPDLSLAEWMCVAMLLFLRKQLIGQEYSMTIHRLMKFPPADQLNTTIPQFIRSAQGLRDRYNQNALRGAGSYGNSARLAVDIPTASQAPPPSIRQTAKRSGVAPWVQHTPNVQKEVPASPINEGGRPDLSRKSSMVNAEVPKQQLGGQAPDPTTHANQLATLTKQMQRIRERDRDIGRKVSRWVTNLEDALAKTPDSKGLPADELRGILDEMRAVASELQPQRRDSVPPPPTTPGASVGDNQGPSEKTVEGTVSTISVAASPSPTTPSVPASTQAIPSSAPPLKAKNEKSQPENPSVSQPVRPHPPRWGSSSDIRHSPGSPIDNPFTQSTLFPSSRPTPSLTADFRPSEAADLVVGTVKAGMVGLNKVLTGLFEDPWADHGVAGRGRGNTTNSSVTTTSRGTNDTGGGQRRGSSQEIRNHRGASGGGSSSGGPRDPLGAGSASTPAESTRIVVPQGQAIGTGPLGNI
ncbi:rab-GTPase-TBC domain-containing protein [Phlyctochytrium arcticum]|nr:rab-GTPase-TBC domain-containing protein [Phlyctochytrium arcticum]